MPGNALKAVILRGIYRMGCYQTERSAHVFALHLLLGEMDLNEGLDCGEELPPRPALHTTVLLNVFLDAPDC